uniref:ATP-binding cassette sub-family A ABCA1 n=1 Tax=Plutella xylostella TaxID=51655 RepID=A0A0S0AGL9_PLUXY|nr:ATP-binding cassette sub-family A ABCA1 [Plutella xylostella]
MYWKKLKLLVWKNFLLQKRHKWQTIFEIASPVIFAMFLILIRSLVAPKSKPGMNYESFQPTYFNISGRSFGNLTTARREGTLAFSPESPLTRTLTKKAIETVVLDNVNGFLALLFDVSMLPEPKGYASASDMEMALKEPNVMNHVLCGIQFEDSMAKATEWPDDVVVTLRFPAVMRTPMVEHPLRASWRTNLLLPLFARPGPRDPDDLYGGKTPGYSGEMFLAVQHAVSIEIIKAKSGQPLETKVLLQRMPQLPYTEDLLLLAMELFISMIIMLCFAYTFVNTVKVVTAEKELQLKETMTIMGLPSWLHWLAWFIKQITYLSISVLLLVILLKIPIKSSDTGERFSVMTHTPWSILIFFLFLFIVTSLAFSFMVSVFFARANTAASFMGLAWFATYSVFMLTQVLYEDISLTTKVLLSLISNTALGFAFQMLIMCEGKSGLQWSNMFKPVSYHDSFQPGHVALMFVLDTILYMMIAMYVEKIRPGRYGVPLPWYFPVTKQFWSSKKSRIAALNRSTTAADAEYNDALLKVVHDEEPQGVPMGIQATNLTKIYRGGRKAVDNLNLKVYENEITVLLGHNGAGKTTTISMLTGTIPPTSGTATINGCDIVTDTGLARASLGICPQHNVLFPDLTAAEHVQFYAQLKGVRGGAVRGEVDHFLKLLDLEQKADVLSKHLSGGQKRRLSVGVAMCGGSRVVLLDEPTSGLDPAARRALWDLLQSEKKGRSMVLTTHFMDEADYLGDRIAIMSGGKLQCVGTPYFLKKHYGLGYKLTIVKGDNCNVEDVNRFLRGHVADVKENTNIGSELTYILLKEDVSKFPNLLKAFEEQKAALNVTSYGLSVTTLEEVFMKVGAESSKTPAESSASGSRNYSGVHFNNNGNGMVRPLTEVEHGHNDMELLQKVRGFKLLRNHIKAMFLKMFYHTKRNKLTNIIQFLSPVINIILSVIIARSWNFLSELPPLTLSLENFKKSETLLSENSLVAGSLEEEAYRAFKDFYKESHQPNMILNDLGAADLGQTYLKMMKSDSDRMRMETFTGATFGPGTITAWFSNYGYHDSAVALAAVDRALMRARLPNATLTVRNHPLPYSIENLVRVMATGSSMGFQFAFNIGFCMAFVTSFLVLFVIKERITGARLLQRISGVRAAVRWGAAFVWDWLWLLLVYLCVVATLAAFQETTLSTPEELGRILLVLMAFSVAIIPLHYLASFYFESAATGFAKMCFLNIFCGSMPFLITEVLRLPEVGSPFYANIFDWIFSPLPIYCLSRSFRDMSMSSFAILACDGLCAQFANIRNCTRDTICRSLNITVCCIKDDPYLDWHEPGIGRYLFTMTMVGIAAFALLMLKEYQFIEKICYKPKPRAALPLDPDEDSDVAAERQIIENLKKNDAEKYSLVCKDLTKYYKDFLAVNRLTFGVRKAECFGLLGINGAGKTSTFRMLTGDTDISAGDALVPGISIHGHMHQVHRVIGYCPQFDALLDNLTARETLRIFCLLRGIPARAGERRARSLAHALGFTRHYDKRIHACSGGTKRKISTAVALLGDAPLVLLDEPTTGMDPASKRLVWECISAMVRGGRGCVLTSHSMEECEALCSTLTVMVRGRLHCLGPLQHLKNKFSQGYTLVVKSKSGPNRDETSAEVQNYIMTEFPGAKFIEKYLGISTYYVASTTSWWKVFSLMEAATQRFAIEDYSVSQTTLEQVFLRFTRLYGHDDRTS